MVRFDVCAPRVDEKRVDARLSYQLAFAGLIAVIAGYYLLLLSNGTFRLFAPEMLDKIFNNMLVHLLRGEFTVDREAIGFEAFTRDGKTYAYFGIFPAVLRLLAIPFSNIAQAELARLSCLTAVVIFVALQLLPALRHISRGCNLGYVGIASPFIAGVGVFLYRPRGGFRNPKAPANR